MKKAPLLEALMAMFLPLFAIVPIDSGQEINFRVGFVLHQPQKRLP
jgi:hypothetical protein